METRMSAVVAAPILGVVPFSSAIALGPEFPFGSAEPRDVETTGSISGRAITSVPFDGAGPIRSAAEGHANPQNCPVNQDGQASGGYRC